MRVLRVVTAQNLSGQSTFQSIEPAPRTHDHIHIPGMANTLVWSTPAIPTVGSGVVDPTPSATSVLPVCGGTSFLIVQFPPDSVMMSPTFDPIAAGRENRVAIPGLAEQFETDHPGMHRTDSVDYCIILEGRLTLELDNGETAEVGPKDVVIQNGTRHAWRNKGPQKAVMAAILIGAQRN